jgi:hypothetical protein
MSMRRVTHTSSLLDMVQQPCHPCGAEGVVNHPHMQADGHHRRRARAFGVGRIERIADEGEPLVGGFGRAGLLLVVVSQAVVHDEMRLALHH